jgi:hypothetical protein
MLDDWDFTKPRATDPLDRFRRIASTAVCSSGTDVSRREEMERELLDHLTDGWERARAMGLTPEVAERRAIAAFGDPVAIRRQFVTRRLLGDVRAAAWLPIVWWFVIAADALAAWIVSSVSHGHDPSSWLVQSVTALTYLGRSVVLLWIGHAGLRLGGRWCGHAFSGRSTAGTAIAGIGVAVASLGLLLALGPGMAFPMLCDAIDDLLGERALLALTALATGSAVAVAGVLRDLVGATTADVQR